MIVRALIEIEVDVAKLDAYNARLYSGEEFDDPVIGDGLALLKDVIGDSCFGNVRAELGHFSGGIVGMKFKIDGKEVAP